MSRRLIALLAGALAAPLFAVPAAATSADAAITMWNCAPDRGSHTTVSITWVDRHSAHVSWRLEDRKADGRAPRLRIRAVSLNGSAPSTTADFFAGGELDLHGGAGASRSGSATWTPPGLAALDAIEVWVNNGVGRDAVDCGWEFAHRMNDYLHSERRPAAASYARSKTLRDRIARIAYAQLPANYHERPGNCSSYSDYFTSPNACRAWCVDFAFYVWAKAGVSGAADYDSSWAHDVPDEWRIAFKPLYGSRLPAVGDMVVFRNRQADKNGHAGIVVATDGWRVKVIDGNVSDRVTPAAHWVDPADNANAFKPILGYASPA